MFNVNTHSSIQIDDLYFDPYGIIKNKNDAKYIFITHTHYDHLSIESLKRVANDNTVFIATKDAKDQLEQHFENKIIYVKPHFKLFCSHWTDNGIETASYTKGSFGL